MNKKILPIGIQTFRKIREQNCYYVDKTGFACRLAEEGSHYFLSRPRRFGKSLFLDTLKELFEGNRELFLGLEAETRWNWTARHPVLRFSFGSGIIRDTTNLRNRLDSQLLAFEEHWNLTNERAEIADRFKELIQTVATQSGQRVVILVDEYDKPILDRIENKDEALAIREVLKDFYSVIKDADAHVHFAFLTGVSKFSKAGIFSGLNNLRDITTSPPYSAICGYTEADLDTVFAPELPGLDREEIRRWYNGYNWLGQAVYNPFDVLLLFQERSFRPWWFQTGTPEFLIKLLMERRTHIPALGELQVDESVLSAFDVDRISTEALLWQTGYMTFDGVEHLGDETFYRLRYPNHEVYSSLHKNVAQALLGDISRETALRRSLWDVLKSHDPDLWRAHFASLFAAIPHDWHRKNDIARYEGYYASVFYSHFAALGLDIRLEDVTSLGRVDMTVITAEEILVFEFKVTDDEPSGQAMRQIKDRDYAAKYRAQGRPIRLVGVEFSHARRTVTGLDMEPA